VNFVFLLIIYLYELIYSVIYNFRKMLVNSSEEFPVNKAYANENINFHDLDEISPSLEIINTYTAEA